MNNLSYCKSSEVRNSALQDGGNVDLANSASWEIGPKESDDNGPSHHQEERQIREHEAERQLYEDIKLES